MEDVFLRVYTVVTKQNRKVVAILVIMEDVFLPNEKYRISSYGKICRNPCYNGRCISTSFLQEQKEHLKCSRNPCYNGRCISTRNFGLLETSNILTYVAILVIMEDVFLRYGDCKNRHLQKSQSLL